MEMKENILANLYAIRGGLSLISQHTDEIKSLESKKVALERAPYRRETSNAYSEVLKLNEEYSRARNVYEGNKKAYEKFRLKTTQGTKEYYAEFNEFQKEAREASCKLIKYVNSRATSPWDSGYDSCLINSAFWIFRIVLFPITIYKVIAYKRRVKALRREFMNNNTMEWSDWLERLNRNKLQTQAAMQANEGKMNAIEKKLRIAEEKYQKERDVERIEKEKRDIVVEQYKTQITEIVNESKMVKLSMNENFDSVLNESDWGNVDLLIYYLETSRADDLKEALQLVDRQKQTQQITKAIADANKSLSTTINTAMNRMGQALSKSFSVISSQLAQISQNQRERIDSLKENTLATERLSASLTQAIQTSAEMKGKAISAQTEAIKLNNALIEKANKHSEELLLDLRYNQRSW